MRENVTPIEILTEKVSYVLEAIMPFQDRNEKREAGDRWLLTGPITYVPREEVRKIKSQKAEIIEKDCGLLLECTKERRLTNERPRNAGEQWIEKNQGLYHIKADEKKVKYLKPDILTQKTALFLEATQTYKDIYGIERKAGDQWLITLKNTDIHLQDV